MDIKRVISGLAPAIAVIACLAAPVATAQEVAPGLDDYGFFRPNSDGGAGPGPGLWRAMINIGGEPPDIDGTMGVITREFDIAGSLFGFGSNDDIGMMEDVNGDGVDDRVVYNSGTREWIWDTASIGLSPTSGRFGDGVAEGPSTAFGMAGDIPLVGDINGDGPADRVLFRPSSQTWHVDFSSAGGLGDGVEETMGGSAFYRGGAATAGTYNVDYTVSLGDYDGDGVADRVVRREVDFAQLYFRSLNPGGAAWSDGTDNASAGESHGGAPPGWKTPPSLGDFDGDGLSDNVAWASSSVFVRFSIAAWEEPLVRGDHLGDPALDKWIFSGNLNQAPPLVPGDYNGDQVVDAADYVIWRKNFGGSGPAGDGTGPGGDGIPDGVVDGHDYDFWRARFGNTSGSGSGAVNGAVPEPGSAVLALLAGLVLAGVKLRRS